MANILKLKKTRKGLLQTIQAEERSLQLEKSSIEAQLSEIRKKIASITEMEKKLSEIFNELGELDELEKEIKSREAEIFQLTNKIQKIKNVNAKIENQGNSLSEKIDFLKESKDKCPLCKRDLPRAYRIMIEGEIKEVLMDRRKDYKENLDNTKLFEKKLKASEKYIKQANMRFLGKEELLNQKEELEIKLESIRKISDEKKELEARLSEINHSLSTGDYAPLVKKMLVEIEEKIENENK